MLDKLRNLSLRSGVEKRKSDGAETLTAEVHANAAAHAHAHAVPLQQQPQQQQHLSPQQMQHLPPQVRAQVEVAHHHDKAGLAPEFRNAGDVKQGFEVDVVHANDLTPDAFWERYVARNVPVLVRGALTAAHGWSPSIDFTEAGLAAAVGHAQIRVRSAPQPSGTFGNVMHLTGGNGPHIYTYVEMSLAEYLKTLHQEPVQYYAARLEIQEDLPELIGDVPSHWGLPWRRAFGQPYKMGTISYMGAKQQSTPLHYDDVENLLFVAAGAKHLELFGPGQSRNLYPAPQRLGTHYSIAPITGLQPGTPEAELFPLLASARGASVTVQAGDMLYLPCCWWHSVRGSPEFNCSFNYWFSQSPRKEEQQIYRAHLQRETDRWVQQLDTMDLPASVMREAHEEAPRMIDQRARLREDFCWDSP